VRSRGEAHGAQGGEHRGSNARAGQGTHHRGPRQHSQRAITELIRSRFGVLSSRKRLTRTWSYQPRASVAYFFPLPTPPSGPPTGGGISFPRCCPCLDSIALRAPGRRARGPLVRFGEERLDDRLKRLSAGIENADPRLGRVDRVWE